MVCLQVTDDGFNGLAPLEQFALLFGQRLEFALVFDGPAHALELLGMRITTRLEAQQGPEFNQRRVVTWQGLVKVGAPTEELLRRCLRPALHRR